MPDSKSPKSHYRFRLERSLVDEIDHRVRLGQYLNRTSAIVEVLTNHFILGQDRSQARLDELNTNLNFLLYVALLQSKASLREEDKLALVQAADQMSERGYVKALQMIQGPVLRASFPQAKGTV